MESKSKVSEVSGLKYINLQDGMVIVKSSSRHRESYGEGIVLSDGNISTVIWENGETYNNLPNNEEWVIFKFVRYLTDHELFVAKLKYSDK
jgi:hypothetical protein